MGALEGHTMIVTGGASGIGAAVCRLASANGATVAVLDRDEQGALALASRIGGHGFACDVADPQSATRAVEAAIDAMGGLTDLVNNAGVGRNKPLHHYSDVEWRLLIGVNLDGTFHCMRAALPALVESGHGSIVNNASLNGVRPLPGEGPYSAAKAAVINLTMTAALEYAPDVRANCVSPGLVDTPLTAMVTATPAWRAAAEAGTPMGRIGAADEVAELIVFLCSDAAGYLTGQNIVIDGGSSLPSLQADALMREIRGRGAQGP